MPFNLDLEAGGFYIPSLNDWVEDYFILSHATLSFPMHKNLALKLTVRNSYDNTPDPGSAKNEFRTLVALSWRF